MQSPKERPVLLGIPLDFNSSYQRGAAEAPPLIREAFRCNSSNSWSETGVDLGLPGLLADSGDMHIPEKGAFEAIERKLANYWSRTSARLAWAATIPLP